MYPGLGDLRGPGRIEMLGGRSMVILSSSRVTLFLCKILNWCKITSTCPQEVGLRIDLVNFRYTVPGGNITRCRHPCKVNDL